MSEPTIDVRRWCTDHAHIYGTTPAVLYALLMLALEPWWADMTPAGRAIMVNGLCSTGGDSKEETRLLTVQAIALADYRDDEWRMPVMPREGCSPDVPHE